MELQNCDNIKSNNCDYDNVCYGYVIISQILVYTSALIALVIIKKPKIIIKEVNDIEENMLLANYNVKERAYALQAAYKKTTNSLDIPEHKSSSFVDSFFSPINLYFSFLSLCLIPIHGNRPLYR